MLLLLLHFFLGGGLYNFHNIMVTGLQYNWQCTYIIGHHNRQQGFVVGIEGH